MTRCIALTKANRPCRAHARRGSNPPLCQSHAGRAERPSNLVVDEARSPAGPADRHRSQGFYQGHFSEAELAELLALGEGSKLEDEIAVVRVMLDRLFRILSDEQELSTAELVRLAPLVFAGARTVSRLLRDRQAISAEVADALQEVFGKALDRLSEEQGIPL